MSWYEYAPYVSVAKRKADAQRKIQKLTKSGKKLSPVVVEGRTIAKTFWGKAWCQNLESYSDYENRLPRGRTYVRNGMVIDLQISQGKIEAQILGSSHYHGKIHIAPLPAEAWKAIKDECSGKIDSVVELLQGKLSQAVMEIITRRAGGLFPKPAEIKLDCSCPDYAGLCKHLSAVLYGVGARLDAQPELLFLLRGVDHTELISITSAIAVTGATESSGLEANLAEIFGIEIADASSAQSEVAPSQKEKKAAPGGKKAPASPKKKAPAKKAKAAKKKRAVAKARRPSGK